MSKLNKDKWIYRHLYIQQQEQGMHIFATAIYKETTNPDWVLDYINRRIPSIIDDNEIVLEKNIPASYSVEWEPQRWSDCLWWKINSIHISTLNMGEPQWDDSIPIDLAEQYNKQELYGFAEDMGLEYHIAENGVVQDYV